MADPVTPGVHIVTCDDPSCVPQYIRLCEDLEQIGVVCVEEGRGDYGFGSFKDKFKEKVESNFYTVIHLCPEMIKKLNQVEHLLGDDRYKAKWVYITTTSTPRPCDLPKVYEDTTRVRFFSETDYQNIVKLLTRHVQSRLQNSPSATSESSAQRPSPVLRQQSPQREQSSEQQSSATSQPSAREQFVRAQSRELSFEDEVDATEGETFFESVGDVYFLNSRLHHSDPDLLKFSGARDLEDICVRSELYTRENRAKTLLWLQTTVLPEVASSGDVASIVVLLKSPIDQIREKAQHIFLKILFSKEIGDIQESHLKAAENTVFDQAIKVNIRKDNSYEGSAVICIYLITIMHRIVSLVDHDRPTTPFFTRRLHGLQAEEIKLNDVIAFLEDFKDRRDVYIRAVRSAEVKDFHSKKCWQSQFVVALRTVMEIFHGDEETRLQALESLTKLLKPHRSGQRRLGRSEVKLHPRVGNLVIIGITRFLKFLEERTGEDLQKETIAAFKVLRQCPELLSDNVKIARDLVFSSNDLIRREGISLLTTTNLYSDVVHFMALSDVSEKLQAINVDLSEAKRKSGSPKSNSWMKLPVGRVSERVMLHIHLPEEAAHNKQMKSALTSSCGHQNTMEILRSLNTQRHILPLLAFRLEQIPVFYVTEDYSQPNLKQVLFSKAKNRQFLQPMELLQLLIQALDGLDYLQRNRIVHRDITASSFTYSREHNLVKLYKFDLARRCNLEQIIVDRDCSGIPTRWSAPESLSKCHFTFRSDCWMVGHLIYEVITHGTLPYSDLDRKSEAEVAELIKRGTKKLPHERCIPTKVFVAIVECTKPHDYERLSLSEARCKLEETQYEYNSSSRRSVRLTENEFPNFSRMTYGDPRRGPAGEFASRGVFPRTTSKICMAEMEADREEMPLYPNTRLLLTIPTIFRVEELETKLDIKEEQKRRLTQEEESFLLTNKLDGFSDHVTVVKYEDGEALSYSIPIGCQGSLQSLVADRYLGDDSLDYIRCLWACAHVLVKLHARNWIHGALSTRNIWIKFTGNKPEVFFSELAYMRESRDDGSGIVSDVTRPPQEEDVIRRSAPEVIHSGTYSPASDVFSFALLVWEVLAGLDNLYSVPNKLKEVATSDLYEYLTTEPGSEIQPQPQECPLEIYSLLTMCWGPERHDRPSIAMVYNKLNEYIRSKSFIDNSDVYLYDDVKDDVYGYEDIPSIHHDGPDFSHESQSQVFDIGDIASASLPTTISTQEAEAPHMSEVLRDLGDGSLGKQQHLEKYLSQHQREQSTGTKSNIAGPPQQYERYAGTKSNLADQSYNQLKLAEQLPRVGAPAVAFTSQSEPPASLTSVATPSDIVGSDVLSPMRSGESFKNKTRPPLPPKPPPHLRIYKPPSPQTQIDDIYDDDVTYEDPPESTRPLFQGTSPNPYQTQGDDIYDDYDTYEYPTESTRPLFQGTSPNPYQNVSPALRRSVQPATAQKPHRGDSPYSQRPVPPVPGYEKWTPREYAPSSPLATVRGQTLPGLSLADNGTHCQAPLDKPPGVPTRPPPRRSKKDNK